jgi:voltage-dependent potassium channel beta subunit
MNYRQLGKHGLKLSELSLGAWITFGNQVSEETIYECMTTAYDAGVNFFDNAEGYANGDAEIVMGNVLKKTGWPRSNYVISTKIFWGGKGPNDEGLSYKHIIEGVNKSLTRLQLDYVDMIFCHRPDPKTPIEETVWAMDQVCRQGKVFYWGTSEWSAAEIIYADSVARQNNLRPPSMEQPKYNLLNRQRFEVEYAPLYKLLGYGTTIFSPLAAGLLTGKYLDGIPEDSRMAMKGNEWLRDRELKPSNLKKVGRLKHIADELGCSLSQMALAWCLLNPNVSTVITGASRKEQIAVNMKTPEFISKLTPDVIKQIDEALIEKTE